MRTIPQGLRPGLAAAFLLALLLAPQGNASADEAAPAAQRAPRAARSVHLHYPAPDGTLYYNEVTVEQSQRGSYFCACGFSHGYFGIQELADGKKVVLFSVWDPAGSDGEKQDPNAVQPDRRVEVLDHGAGVRVRRFGGEGTGAQSFLDFAWEPGQACRFLVRATPEGDKTTYSAWFHGQEGEQPDPPDRKEQPDGKEQANPADQAGGWKHMATFRTAARGEPMRGYYSFVEDFRRDGKSPNEPRSARFGNGWVKSTSGDWVRLTRARFTADATPLSNIDADVSEKDGTFRLATGGDTHNTHALNSLLRCDPPGLSLPDLQDRRAQGPGTQKSP